MCSPSNLGGIRCWKADPKIVVFTLRRLNVKERKNQSVSLSDFLCLVRTGTMGASLTIS